MQRTALRCQSRCSRRASVAAFCFLLPPWCLLRGGLRLHASRLADKACEHVSVTLGRFHTRESSSSMSVARSVSAAVAPPRVVVSGAGSNVVNGTYARRSAAAVPAAFALVCRSSGWDAAVTWSRLNGPRDWWEETSNASYIYFNGGDRQWWLDSGETGLGLYVSSMQSDAPPAEGWTPIGDGVLPLPTVSVG